MQISVEKRPASSSKSPGKKSRSPSPGAKSFRSEVQPATSVNIEREFQRFSKLTKLERLTNFTSMMESNDRLLSEVKSRNSQVVFLAKNKTFSLFQLEKKLGELMRKKEWLLSKAKKIKKKPEMNSSNVSTKTVKHSVVPEAKIYSMDTLRNLVDKKKAEFTEIEQKISESYANKNKENVQNASTLTVKKTVAEQMAENHNVFRIENKCELLAEEIRIWTRKNNMIEEQIENDSKQITKVAQKVKETESFLRQQKDKELEINYLAERTRRLEAKERKLREELDQLTLLPGYRKFKTFYNSKSDIATAEQEIEIIKREVIANQSELRQLEEESKDVEIKIQKINEQSKNVQVDFARLAGIHEKQRNLPVTENAEAASVYKRVINLINVKSDFEKHRDSKASLSDPTKLLVSLKEENTQLKQLSSTVQANPDPLCEDYLDSEIKSLQEATASLLAQNISWNKLLLDFYEISSEGKNDVSSSSESMFRDSKLFALGGYKNNIYASNCNVFDVKLKAVHCGIGDSGQRGLLIEFPGFEEQAGELFSVQKGMDPWERYFLIKEEEVKEVMRGSLGLVLMEKKGDKMVEVGSGRVRLARLLEEKNGEDDKTTGGFFAAEIVNDKAKIVAVVELFIYVTKNT